MAETGRARITELREPAAQQRRRFRYSVVTMRSSDLYPVRVRTPSSHNQYSRVPKPESAGGEPGRPRLSMSKVF
jgi:hypothetical protein